MILPSKYSVPISSVLVAHEINLPEIKSSSNQPYSTGNLSLNLWMVSEKQQSPAGGAAIHRDLT
jgi:hypothetical protein